MRRLFAAFAVTLFTVVGLSVAAPTASARPAPAQAIATSFGATSFWVRIPQCSGTVRTVLTTDRMRPGTVQVTYVPSRFTRSCRFSVWASWGWGAQSEHVSLASGPRGGPAVTHTYHTGSGVQPLSFGHQQSSPPSGIMYYVLVP